MLCTSCVVVSGVTTTWKSTTGRLRGGVEPRELARVGLEARAEAIGHPRDEDERDEPCGLHEPDDTERRPRSPVAHVEGERQEPRDRERTRRDDPPEARPVGVERERQPGIELLQGVTTGRVTGAGSR
jgi:hypothetical protein